MIADEIAEILNNSGLGNPHDIGEWVDVRKEMPTKLGWRYEVLIRQDSTGEVRRAVWRTIWLESYARVFFRPTDYRSLEGQWRVIAWLKTSSEM